MHRVHPRLVQHSALTTYLLSEGPWAAAARRAAHVLGPLFPSPGTQPRAIRHLTDDGDGDGDVDNRE